MKQIHRMLRLPADDTPEILPDLSGRLGARYRELVRQEQIHYDSAQITALKVLEELAQQFAAPFVEKKPSFVGRFFSTPKPRIKGVYIHGGVGRGKSMLMDLFFDHCPVQPKRRVHFHAFMIEVHAFMHDWRKTHEGDPIPPLSHNIREFARLLCFDEFHVHDIADAMILARLFSALFDLGVVMVATSNRRPEDLYLNGLQRQRFLPFIDLLKERNTVIELNARHDYRLAHMRAFSVLYFTPLGDASERFVRASFEELASGPAVASILHVNGRPIQLLAAHGDIAMADFADLCEKPLGAADYLELAFEFSTLILCNIPRLTPEKLNEAKRFVTLVDALYERRVKVICSAEVAPEQLYTKGVGAFEFERTVSRLKEMQTERYWRSAHQSD